MINAADVLKVYNEWRRGAETTQPNPVEIGVAIDSLIAENESLKNELSKARACALWENSTLGDADRTITALKEENERQNQACRYTSDLLEQAMADIASLKEENERLEAMNEKLASPNMKSMRIEGGGLDMVLEGGASALLIQAFAQQFKDQSLGNYVELQFHAPEIGAMTVTIQRVNGQTPGMKAGLLAAECDALKARVAELCIAMENVAKIYGTKERSTDKQLSKAIYDGYRLVAPLASSEKEPANEG